jgi:DNA invertase Pin-like site-specific DNA recombinase
MRQVMENVESTKRQYALRNRATALGWRDDQIIVIDNDQGESGVSAARREGFQRLVTDVGIGHAGLVMGLEVSGLARNNADWHRLLETAFPLRFCLHSPKRALASSIVMSAVFRCGMVDSPAGARAGGRP